LCPIQGLGKSLLRHFIQSSLSCRIVDVLVASDAGMHEADITAVVNDLQQHLRSAMPPNSEP
jgi:GTPase involved in cell partitioning and DNA repair